MPEEKTATPAAEPQQETAFEPTPPPPGADEVDWSKTQQQPAVTWDPENLEQVDTEKQELDQKIAEALGEAGAEKALTPDQAVERELQEKLGDEKQAEGPQDKSTPATDTEPEGEKQDEFAFPEPELPLDLLGDDGTQDADPGDNVDVDGIVSKYVGDAELPDELKPGVLNLAKAYKSQQQQFSEQAAKLRTLEEVIEKLQSSPTPPGNQEADAEAEQPSATADVPVDAVEQSMPTEDELEDIIAEEGYAGLYKRILQDAGEKYKADLRRQEAERQKAQQQALEAERAEHNNRIFFENARQYLRDQAIAAKDKAAFEKYSKEGYVPTEDEVTAVLPKMQKQLDILRNYMRPDETGKFSRDHMDAARKVAYFDQFVSAAEKRGYEKALKDIKASTNGRTVVHPRQPNGKLAPSPKVTVSPGDTPATVGERIHSNMSTDSIEAELAKLRKEGVF